MVVAFRMLEYSIPLWCLWWVHEKCLKYNNWVRRGVPLIPNDAGRLQTSTLRRETWISWYVGCLDCMHWQRENCPTAWHGQSIGYAYKPTIILVAVAGSDLWIWHAFFGMPGSSCDINVLDWSHLFTTLAGGRAPPAKCTINGHHYSLGYFLVDVIFLNGNYCADSSSSSGCEEDYMSSWCKQDLPGTKVVSVLAQCQLEAIVIVTCFLLWSSSSSEEE